MPKEDVSADLCTCGHVHTAREKCGAIVSGTPMLTYCQCPGMIRPGEHLRNPTGTQPLQP